MKRLIGISIALLFLSAFGGTLYYLYGKSRKPAVEFATETPFSADIVEKTVATGSVVPRREVEIKPQISGIVEELLVEAGDLVRRGELVARIRVVPDMVSLNEAENRLARARISLANARLDLERNRPLVAEGTIPESSFQQLQMAVDNAEEEYRGAESHLQIVEEGASSSSAASNTLVGSTIAGMVLEVPVEVGNSVIEANTFNDGTTLVTVADMDEMVFEGKVDESEVGKLELGMEMVLTVGALEEARFQARLEHIAPTGVEEDGAIQFAIRAAIQLEESQFLRANYSANADVVLDRREQVLAIREALLQFDSDNRAFVEVEVAPQQFESRVVELGLSDGLTVEVLGGLAKDDRVKDPGSAG
ncbi:MAG: efflux RND transporter periplasmic adaptor subunit [Holophagales bacterium]|nr:efflux RND transporter periplasmic adaptor subunit [Holophagales bacterium]